VRGYGCTTAGGPEGTEASDSDHVGKCPVEEKRRAKTGADHRHETPHNAGAHCGGGLHYVLPTHGERKGYTGGIQGSAGEEDDSRSAILNDPTCGDDGRELAAYRAVCDDQRAVPAAVPLDQS